jgi:cytochrome c-type biogenesis protein CcmH
MVFWSIAITVTAIACALLYYAAVRRPVNAARAEAADSNRHFRLALAGIEADLAAGKIGEPEAVAAKAELAREMLREERERGEGPAGSKPIGRGTVLAGLGLICAVSVVVYVFIGSPQLPGQPLASRPEVLAQDMDLDAAIAQIEARLAEEPDDLRGWTVIAPAYMELGRYEDAEHAFRRIIELSGPTADAETNLAEALLMQEGGNASGEAMDLLQSAAARDPDHIRSRFYVAGELTRVGDYEAAVAAWNELIELASGDEPWLATARQGLQFAEAGGEVPDTAPDEEAIAGMVAGLQARLDSEGGSIAEWTQLVRAYLVLEDRAAAQAAYNAAVAAYPQAFDRGELDTIALGAGLELNGDE